METWDLDHADMIRLRGLLQHDLLRWGADAGGDLQVTIKGGEGSLRAWPLPGPQDDGIDLLDIRFQVEGYQRAAQSVRDLTRTIDVLLHGEDGAAKQASLCDLVGPIEHLVKRCWELQDRVVELERKAGKS